MDLLKGLLLCLILALPFQQAFASMSLAKKYFIIYGGKTLVVEDGAIGKTEAESIPWRKKRILALKELEGVDKIKLVYHFSNFHVEALKIHPGKIGDHTFFKEKKDQKPEH